MVQYNKLIEILFDMYNRDGPVRSLATLFRVNTSLLFLISCSLLFP